MRKEVKRFSVKILMITAPFLLLFSWTEFLARRLSNSFAVKLENFEQVHDSVEVLVLGSSHALKGINTALFSCKGFNFSNSSQTLVYDSRICLKYLDRMPMLKVVIIDLSYISFFYALNDSPEKWKDYFYYHYFGFRDIPVNRFSPAALTYTGMYTRGTLNDLIFGKLNPKEEFGDIQPGGWEKTPVNTDTSRISELSGKNRALLHNSLINPANFPENISWFERMLSALSKSKIRVFFVSTPVLKSYSDNLIPDIQVKNKLIITEMSEKYGIPYFDYSNDPFFVMGDFYDNDHLNSRGAEKFSRLLDREILAPLCSPK
jgi:hypothetical protein